MKKNNIFLHLLNKKNWIHSIYGIFTNKYWVGWVGPSNFAS